MPYHAGLSLTPAMFRYTRPHDPDVTPRRSQWHGALPCPTTEQPPNHTSRTRGLYPNPCYHIHQERKR